MTDILFNGVGWTDIALTLNHGYVTNLLAELGDYVNVGVNTISLVEPIHSGSMGISRKQTSLLSGRAIRRKSS